MEFMDKKTLYEKNRDLVLPGITIKQAKIVEVNKYGEISANNEAGDNFYIVKFTSILHTIQ